MLGKYQLEKQLSDNGRIVTYLARDQAGHAVLLKVLPPHRRTLENIAYLERQAKTLAALDDPRLPHVLETSEIDGYHLIALEYAEGKTLAALLEERQRAPFDPARALDILRKTANALEVAQARGIFHGNLTPQDILISDAGEVHLFGFGEADANAWISAEMPMQKARYLAPEQLEPQGETDRRVDVYALGVILYEMLTGHPPFEAALLNTLLYAVLRSNVRIPTLYNPALSDEIEETILKAMSRDPQARYSSPQALVETLRQAIAAGSAESQAAAPRAARPTAAAKSLRTVPALEARTSPASTELPRGAARRYRDRLRRRNGGSWGGMIIALTIVAVALAVGAGVLSSRPGRLLPTQPSATLAPSPSPTETLPEETPSPTETPEEIVEPTEEPVGLGTPTNTVNPRRTLKAQGTSTPTPAPTRTKVVVMPTIENMPTPTDTPVPTATPVEYPSGNLIRNPEFEEGFSERGASELSVAEGWQPWWQDGPGQQEGYYRRPEYKPEDADRYGGRRVRSGRYAQKFFSTFSTHNAGFFQQVSVIPGGRCTFTIWAQVWSSRDPSPDTVVEPGNYRVMVGIDPTGGTNWSAPSVVWGEQRVEYNNWIQLSVSAIAQGGSVTVFTRGFPEYRVQFNDSYWDDAELYEEAP